MNREQWNSGRKYEKLPEPKMEWEAISPSDPRWHELLDKVKDGDFVVVENQHDAPSMVKWEDAVPPKPKLL